MDIESVMPVAFAGVLVATGICLAIYSLTSQAGAARKQVLANLDRNLVPRHGSPAPSQSGGVNAGVHRFARAVTPGALVGFVDRLLAGAGRPKGWPLERVLVVKILLGALMGAVGLLLIDPLGGARGLAMTVLLAMLGFFMPEILLYNESSKRRTKITRALPDVLDQLTIAVEAGLGFEAALAHVGRNSPGPLGDELVRTLQDIQVGTSRREAYNALAERCQVDDLTRFVRAIGQAERFGVSIAAVLETQAREMRLKRKQRAEEAALKIPVKVTLPLTLFILPTLFVVVLGPAVINAIETFPRGGFPGSP